MRDTDPQKMNVADWPEASQADLEAAEVALIEAEQAYRRAIVEHPAVFRAYQAMRDAEQRAFEARRARRASEVRSG